VTDEHRSVAPHLEATGRRGTQRERILGAMIEIAANEGYGESTIARVIAHAGVSRPTFYDYFADRDDCFLAALAEVEREPLDAVGRAVLEGAPEDAVGAALEVLVELAAAEPAKARLLMDEPLVCGIRALDSRDRRIAEIVQIVEAAHARALIPDIPLHAVIGGVERLLAAHARSGEATALADLLAWIRCYAAPAEEHRWRAMRAVPPAAPSPYLVEPPMSVPMELGGRPCSSEEVAENQRQRIIFAAAAIAAEKGCSATTLGEISEHSGVDGRALRRLFSDREEIFAAVHELYFQRVVAVTAVAFFAGESWPERVWEAGRAFVPAIEQNSTLAHLTVVQFHAAGPAAVERHNEFLQAFTVFLEEGYEQVASGSLPPRIALEAIAQTNFETLYTHLRSSDGPGLSSVMARATFLDMAPFLGPTAANRFIDRKLGEQGLSTPG
jgi:AcrR family transcriptional regulator